MIQPPDTENSSTSPNPIETLGQYLRRVRIGNGIDLKKMSADTRLSLDILLAVEKDDYKKIPGPTYQKVFIKNISKYLGLDSEKTYQRFLHESGTDEVSLKIFSPSDQKTVAPSPEIPPTKGLLTVLAILAVIFILFLLARQSLTSENPKPSGENSKNLAEDSSASENSESEVIVDDSTSAPIVPQDIQQNSEPLPSDVLPAKRNHFSIEKRGGLKVTVTCFKDSCYVQARRNGQPWNNFFRQGEYKTFASDSALYFKIEPLANANLSLNGAPLNLAPANGAAFRIGKNGAESLSEEGWIKLNGGR